MRCLILTNSAAPEGGAYPVTVQTVKAQLEAMTISFDRNIVSNVTAAGVVAAGYDFVIVPNQGATGTTSTYKAFVDSVDLTIPVLQAALTGDSSTWSATPGVTGTMSSAAEQFFTSPFSTSLFTAMEGRYCTLTTGTPLMTVSAVSPIDGSAQTHAGKVSAWYAPKAGGKNCYYWGVTAPASYPMMAFFIQAMYNAGDLTAAQMQSIKRLPVVIDQDHVTGIYFYYLTSDYHRWADKIPSTGVSWGGLTAGVADGVMYLTDEVAALLAAEKAKTSGKRIKFCYHEHTTGRDSFTGTWPSGTTAVSKADQDTYYRDMETKVQAINSGIGYDVNPGYYDPGTNMWTEETLQLMSRETSLASDPLNASAIAGYGFTVVRHASGNTASRPCVPTEQVPRAQYSTRNFIRGITLVQGADICPENSGATLSNWATRWKNYCNAVAYGMSLYVHDEDFVDPQAPATGEFGEEVLNTLNQMSVYLKDVAEFWADPTRYGLEPNYN